METLNDKIYEEVDLTEQVGDYQLIKNNNMSNLWNLDWKDIFKGLVTSIYGALLIYLFGVFAGLYQSVINGLPFNITVDSQAMIVIGVFAGLSYLMTRYTSDTKGDLLGSNTK